jgi:hypothetical protein
MDCPECGAALGRDCVMDIGVVLTPVYRGDLAVSYLCKKCSSLVEMRYRRVVKHAGDLSRILLASEPPCLARRYEDIVWEHQHGQDHSRQ